MQSVFAEHLIPASTDASGYDGMLQFCPSSQNGTQQTHLLHPVNFEGTALVSIEDGKFDVARPHLETDPLHILFREPSTSPGGSNVGELCRVLEVTSSSDDQGLSL
jgi:hypothetical protein